MPTTDIIGYLWSNRQELELDGLPEVLHMIADLQEVGLECVEVGEVKVFGVPLEASGRLIRRTDEEWNDLVHKAILSSAVEHTIGMIHQHEDGDEK